MLFWRAPREIEIVHRTKAPVVPSAPTEPPRDAIRKAGLRKGHDEAVPPCHRLEELSLLDLGGAIDPPSLVWASRLVPIGTRDSWSFYHPLRTRQGGHGLLVTAWPSCATAATTSTAPAEPTRARPVLLATLAVGVHPSAERMAIDSAIEAGVPLCS